MTFEVVVRPAVFPNIRPGPRTSGVSTSTRAQPASSATTNPGMATIHGASGRYLELPYSVSFSTSTPKYKEKKRRVDEGRVYQKKDDGSIEKENFVDVQSANKLWMDTSQIRAGTNITTKYTYTSLANDPPDNVEIRRRNVMIYGS